MKKKENQPVDLISDKEEPGFFSKTSKSMNDVFNGGQELDKGQLD